MNLPMLTLDMDHGSRFVPRDAVVHVGPRELQFLRDALGRSPDDSACITITRAVDPAIEETFLTYRGSARVLPCSHLHDDTSLLAIDGAAEVLLFDDSGTAIRVIRIGDRLSGLPYFCRIPRGNAYTVCPRSDPFVCLRAMSGPLSADAVHVPAWASAMGPTVRPAPSPVSMGHASAETCDVNTAPIRLSRINPHVLSALDPLVTLSAAENELLLAERTRHGLDRLRICVHTSVDERLHEMLMAFTPTTYIRPSLHVDKEESLVVIQGLATVIFFDARGKITSTVKLGGVESQQNFYCRIPANTYHGLLVESEDILLKETARGPFRRSDTVFPAWAPDGSTHEEASRYVEGLKHALSLHGPADSPPERTAGA